MTRTCLLRWLRTGVLTVGLMTGALAGVGVAVADDGTSSGASPGASSATSNSTGNNQDSDKLTTKHDSKAGDKKRKPVIDEPPTMPADDTDATSASADHGATPDPKLTGEDAPKKKRDHATAEPATHENPDQRVKPANVDADAKKAVDNADPTAAEPPGQKASTVLATDAVAPVEAVVAESTAKQSLVATTFAAAAATPAVTSPLTAAINAVGNLFFNVLALVTNLGAGPPVLPPGSTVTVSRSTLQVGGKTVTADWYFPDESEPPAGLIYFQHGAFAVGSMYSYTAAQLAEQTNSIVVAPTMSTNGFAPDGMWLGGAPLQTATADLFEGDRAALTVSAQAAGYDGALPDQFVLAGHSLGGVFVTAVAGYLADDAINDDDDAIDDLKGVVLFDPTPSAGQDSVVSVALGKLPADLPVYLIGSPPSYWNELGSVANALVTARPSKFVGVILDGGSHADSLQGGNPPIQFIENVVSGVPKQQNIAAVKTLASGWINDMFHGTDDGIYASPGDVFTIDTYAGTATAYTLPDTHHQASLFQVLLTKLVDFFLAGLGSQG